jgi:hypothetical protein
MYTSPLAFGQSVGRSLLSRRNAGAVAAADQGQAFTPIPDVYAIRRAYYDGSQYDALRGYGTDIGSVSALPRTIRAVLQIVKPAADWWRDNLYRGAWTSDGRPSSTGKPNMVPWEDDSPGDLVAAAQQLLTWANWPEVVREYTFYGPVYGDVFLENQIDYERQKVYPIVIDPSFITHLVLDGSGNVVAYRVSIPRWDVERKQPFTWSKLVTKTRIATYYNNHDQGFETIELRDGSTGIRAADNVKSDVDNPFGFAPAAWVNHRRSGGIHGECAFDGMFGSIDEINGLQAALNDYVMRIANQKIIVGSDDPAGMLKTMEAAVKLGSTIDLANPSSLRELVNIWPAPSGVTAIRMLEDVGLEASVEHLNRITENIRTNLPEATIEERLSQAGDVTGPGARAIVAPVQRKLDASCPSYDRGTLAVTLMGISMTGELIRAGIFTERTDALAKFAQYNLQSWDRGDLSSLGIQSRDLVPETMAEKAATWAAVERLQTPTALKSVLGSDGLIYGVDANGKPLTPTTPDQGILAEKQAARDAASFAASTIFNSNIQ